MKNWGPYGWLILEGKLAAVVLTDLHGEGARCQQQMREAEVSHDPLEQPGTVREQSQPMPTDITGTHRFNAIATCWQWAPQQEKPLRVQKTDSADATSHTNWLASHNATARWR